MNSKRSFNICENFSLYCMEQVELNESKGVRLSCMLNGKKVDGKAQKGFPISVVCMYDSCEFDKTDFSKSSVDVYGGLTASSYLGKDGTERVSATLFADRVKKHEWVEGESVKYNMCVNLSLYCMEQVELSEGKGVRLSCMLNGKKVDGKFQKGLPISVICVYDTCDIEKTDLSKCRIDVYGRITASEYKAKDGSVRSSLTVFADKVIKHEWK